MPTLLNFRREASVWSFASQLDPSDWIFAAACLLILPSAALIIAGYYVGGGHLSWEAVGQAMQMSAIRADAASSF